MNELPKPDGLKLNDEQVKAMMEWQLHAAYWVASQAVILTEVANDEGLHLGDDDVLATSLNLFKIARDEDDLRSRQQNQIVDLVGGTIPLGAQP